MKFVENSVEHEIIKKLLNECDIKIVMGPYGSPLNQMLKHKSFVFDMFYEKYPNIFELKTKYNRGLYTEISTYVTNELLIHILNKVDTIDYNKLLSDTSMLRDKREIIVSFINNKSLSVIEKYNILIKEHEDLKEKYNILNKENNDLKESFDVLNKKVDNIKIIANN